MNYCVTADGGKPFAQKLSTNTLAAFCGVNIEPANFVTTDTDKPDYAVIQAGDKFLALAKFLEIFLIIRERYKCSRVA